MKASFFVFTFLLLMFVHFSTSEDVNGQNNHKDRMHYKRKHSRVSSKVQDSLNLTTFPRRIVRDLDKIREKSDIVEFYSALEELYLSGGFDKKGTINSIILSQSSIPDDVYDQLIDALETTRYELKNGDSSLSGLTSMLDGGSTQVKEILAAVKRAFRELTKTSDNQIVMFDGESELGSFKEKMNSDDFKKLKEAVGNAISNKNQDVKTSLIAGARLIYNLGGSVENAKRKCSEVSKAIQIDDRFDRKVIAADDLVKRLNRSNSHGDVGYKLLFEAYIESPAPKGNMIFFPSKTIDLKTMQNLFSRLLEGDSKLIGKVVRSMAINKYYIFELNQLLKELEGDGQPVLDRMEQEFGVKIPDQKAADNIKSILHIFMKISVNVAYINRHVRSVIAIEETGNYENFLNLLLDASKLSRNNRWRDVWFAVNDATIITSHESAEVLTPFKGLNETVRESYQEVFLAMLMLLSDRSASEVDVQCQFISEFFTGLKDFEGTLNALGIQVEKYHKWIEATKSVDALVQVLKIAENFENLNRLLAFHAKYTTVDRKPWESLDLITNLIVFMEDRGKWKRFKFPFPVSEY